MNALATIGHNNPPEPTPYEALKAHVDDLELEATNHLDGKPIETEAQAEAIARIRDDALKARKLADGHRKEEVAPLDEARAKVQALWTPLSDEKKGRCALIEQTCKNALATWLIAREATARAAAEAAEQEARRQADAAAQAARDARPDDLAGQATARILQENASDAQKKATRLAKAPVQARGGERAVSLRSVWNATLSDPVAALRYYRERQPDELKAWLVEQAERDVRSGARAIPGFVIEESRYAV